MSSSTLYTFCNPRNHIVHRGSVNSIGGKIRNKIAALDATTGEATSWNPNANNAVSTIVVSGSTVYTGGDFTTIGGETRNYIAALDATTGAATSWNRTANGVVMILLLVEVLFMSGAISQLLVEKQGINLLLWMQHQDWHPHGILTLTPLFTQ